MGRRCQICSNTRINIINRALLGGATLSEIARRHSLAQAIGSAGPDGPPRPRSRRASSRLAATGLR